MATSMQLCLLITLRSIPPTSDQSALTTAQLLIEHIVSRHGVPSELLSDCDPAFLSKLMKEICKLMGIQKTNTMVYHPQMDGLVERFKRTLIDMLTKTVEKGGRDWDSKLLYVLFAHHASPQESTKESPFYLLYGRDPQLPTEEALSPPTQRTIVDIDNYKTEVTVNLQEAWELVKKNIKRAQHKQKKETTGTLETPHTGLVIECLYTPQLRKQAPHISLPGPSEDHIVWLKSIEMWSTSRG